jgi:hypothetical protein
MAMRHAKPNEAVPTESSQRSNASRVAWIASLLTIVAVGAGLEWWRAVAVHGPYASLWQQLRSLLIVPLLAIEWVLFLSAGAFWQRWGLSSLRP